MKENYLNKLPGIIHFDEYNSYDLTITKEDGVWTMAYQNDGILLYPQTGYEKHNRANWNGGDLFLLAKKMYDWLIAHGYEKQLVEE